MLNAIASEVGDHLNVFFSTCDSHPSTRDVCDCMRLCYNNDYPYYYYIRSFEYGTDIEKADELHRMVNDVISSNAVYAWWGLKFILLLKTKDDLMKIILLLGSGKHNGDME